MLDAPIYPLFFNSQYNRKKVESNYSLEFNTYNLGLNKVLRTFMIRLCFWKIATKTVTSYFQDVSFILADVAESDEA